MVPTDKTVPVRRPRITALLEDVVGCKWSWSILRVIHAGTIRPGQIERAIEGLSTKVLNERLRKLVAHGVLKKTEFAEVPPRVEYEFTELGRKFVGVLQQIEALEREPAQHDVATDPLDAGEGMNPDTCKYNLAQAPNDRAICDLLAQQIDRALPEAENKIWHAHPVWFLDGNPIVGYSKLKDCVRLLFWSGQSFKEQGLQKEGRFKAAEARFNTVDQVDMGKLARWLAEARDIQWDYKNLVRRKGQLERLR
jgi:DNA-binding HxlR family transcriptional regulator